MDIVTDLLVLSFPFIILWKVRINVNQKIGLAFSLCLSCVMVVIAVVRIAGIRQSGGIVDIVWLMFWQQQECSIAVFMVSVSAFRSLFVASPTRNPAAGQHRFSPCERPGRLLHRRLESDLDDVERNAVLPQIPGATLTCMSTIIGDRRYREKADGSWRSQGSFSPSSNGRSTRIHTVNPSAQDAEPRFLAEPTLPSEPSLTPGAERSRFSGRLWWKAPWQSDIDRTGYWDIMSLFKMGHTESPGQSSILSESQL